MVLAQLREEMRWDEMMRCCTQGVIFERGAQVWCDGWQALFWTVEENIQLLKWWWVHSKVDIQVWRITSEKQLNEYVLTGVKIKCDILKVTKFKTVVPGHGDLDIYCWFS
jgi:hypothetical protein